MESHPLGNIIPQVIEPLPRPDDESQSVARLETGLGAVQLDDDIVKDLPQHLAMDRFTHHAKPAFTTECVCSIPGLKNVVLHCNRPARRIRVEGRPWLVVIVEVWYTARVSSVARRECRFATHRERDGPVA